jgi:N-acetylglutamate synthase-like GNAT family acetyltransferase
MEYITGNIDNFLTIQIDGKLAGCVEIIQIDDDTIEL